MTRRVDIWKYVLGILLTSIGTLLMAQQGDGPKLTAIEPKAGITSPGTKVTIFGTGLSPDAVVYLGGLQARETKFISPSNMEVVTPYLRPGSYQIQIKSGGIVVRSEVTFTASPAPIDMEIDRAVALAGQGQAMASIAILTAITKSEDDYQVRAFAHYQTAQTYFAQGDWWRWGSEAGEIFTDSDKSGASVQTSWRYRLASDQTDYFLPTNSQPDHDLKLADWTVKYDVTENAEPRFFRGLVNARYGNLEQAKADSDFILKQDPNNLSYRALAAYVAVLSGDKSRLPSFSDESIMDARALSLLGEAAYLSGNLDSAKLWWAQAAKIYPLGASLACLAGKKHLARGQQHIAEGLLTECISMAPDGKEAIAAKKLLSATKGPGS